MRSGAWDTGPFIPNDVSINGISVGGLTARAARNRLAPEVQRMGALSVRFSDSGRSWQNTLKNLGMTIDLDGTIEKALTLRPGPDHLFPDDTAESRKSIAFLVGFQGESLNDYLGEIAADVHQTPVDARYSFLGGDVEIIPHVNGRELDLAATRAELEALLTRPVRTAAGLVSAPLVLREIPPAVETEDLREIHLGSTVSSYSTLFDPNLLARTHNIAIASGRLDGTVIPPGGVFSFNDTVGPRTAAAGFEEALIIEEQEFVPGLGGGVCQVVSTLYNAALRADLAVVERTRHSLLITYVPVGLDATVAYGLIDLELKNVSRQYLAIRTAVAGDTLTMDIVGEQPLDFSVEIENIIEARLAPKTKVKTSDTLPAGEEIVEEKGKEGYRVRVERVLRRGGTEIQREIVSRDTYPAEQRVIIRGTDSQEEGGT